MVIVVDKYLNQYIKVRYRKRPRNLFELDSSADIRRWMRTYFPGMTEDDHKALRDGAKILIDSLQTLWHYVADKECQRVFKRPWQFSDYRVSGIGRKEFSDRVKLKLREIVYQENLMRDISYAHNQMLPLKKRK